MPPRALDSPLLSAFLRALTFAGLTEAIFYRLLPGPPATGSAGGLLERAHGSLNRLGNMTFIIAFFFVALALAYVAFRALRWRIWPAGLNGLLATCLLSLSVLGFFAVVVERGPFFALAFTLVASLTLLLVAMHAWAVTGSLAGRCFVLLYCSAAICSSAGTAARILLSYRADRGRAAITMLEHLSSGSIQAGRLLLAGAAAAAFLSCAGIWDEWGRRRERAGFAILLGALAGAGYATGALMVPPYLSLREPGVGPVMVAFLSWALFLGVATAAINMLQLRRGPLAYGLLLLVLAGFPLRIAYQQMLAVLGAVLVFAPEPAPDQAPDPDPMAHAHRPTIPPEVMPMGGRVESADAGSAPGSP